MAQSTNAPEKYVALARRYRPTRFDEVIGQRHVTQTLQNAIVAGRVHHAYLFMGSRGVGKTTVARILARCLNHPEGPTADPTPVSDEAKAQGQTDDIDLLEIDGASHTSVDDVRQLRESVRYLPSQSRYKIIIIDEVHMLSTSAFNALLKTLEEPPAHVIFMFATTEPHKIPATILSRCQRFDFKRVATDEIVAHLKKLTAEEGIQLPDAALAMIARAAEGGVRDSLSLLDQVIAFCGTDAEITTEQVSTIIGVADRRTLFDLSAAILERDATSALGLVDKLFNAGHDLAQFSGAFLQHLRDLIVVRSCENPQQLVDVMGNELEQLTEQGNHENATLLPQHFERFLRTAEEIGRSNQPKLLVEMAVIEMVHAEPLIPLGDLLERLELLERQLGSGSRGGGGGGRGGARPTSSAGRSRASAGRSQKASSASAPRDMSAASAGPSPDVMAADKPRAVAPVEAKAATKPAPAQQTPVADAPVAATSPAPSVRKSDNPDFERWQALLKRLGGPVVAAFLAGRFIRWEGKEIELAYPDGAFEFQLAKDDRKQAQFSRLAAEALGQPIELHVRVLTAAEANSAELARQSAIQVEQEREQDSKRALREEAESHPLTRTLIDGFGAKIKRVDIESST